MPTDTFNPESLHGITFWSGSRKMRYMYPDCGHWTAGWIVVQSVNGSWMTLRKATDKDIADINKAVVGAHHHGPK